MLEQILVYERDAFLWLNSLHTPYLDRFMWIYSGNPAWIPLAVFILFALCYRRPWRESVLLILALALAITLCDQFASGFCKPFFARFRPTRHPDFMHVVQTVISPRTGEPYLSGRYGFMSSHAANTFGFALFTSLLFRHRVYTVCLFLWAAAMSYTRIYLGVHFLSDIIPGALFGLLFIAGITRSLRSRAARKAQAAASDSASGTDEPASCDDTEDPAQASDTADDSTDSDTATMKETP